MEAQPVMYIYKWAKSANIIGRVARPLMTAALYLTYLTISTSVASAADEWGQPVVPVGRWSDGLEPEYVANAAASPGLSGRAADDTPLAERVRILEGIVRRQQVGASYANMESVNASEPGPNGCNVTPIDIIAKPTHKLRGRLFTDGIFYDDDDGTAGTFGTDRENEFGFDTARIGIQGDIFENIRYVFEVEFEGTEVDFKDAFAEMHSLPGVGAVRAGHFKEPIGLEELTSSRFDTFMEQSYASSAFTPGRNFGVMIYNDLDPCQDATWFLGVFRSESDDSPPGRATQRDDRNDASLTSRIAWVPYYDEPSGGRYLVHLGSSYSYRNAADDAEFAPKAYIGNQAPIGVGAVADSDTWNQLGAEAALVWGAFSVQSEYFHAFVTSGENYHGAYVQFSYFLTGEHRGYKKGAKTFNRVHPFEPAFWIDGCGGHTCGRGAWELTSAYSYVDLEDGDDISVGIEERAFVDGLTFGVNWYLNPYSRVMFNYNYEVADYVTAGQPDSNANLFGVRWQVDW